MRFDVGLVDRDYFLGRLWESVSVSGSGCGGLGNWEGEEMIYLLGGIPPWNVASRVSSRGFSS